MAAETAQVAAKSKSKSSTRRIGHKAASTRTQREPKKAAAKRARRRQSSAGERQRILATAEREGLTALQVQKRFGVKPVTYYSWRKKLGMKGRRGRRPAGLMRAGRETGALAGLDVAAHVRHALRAEIARILPEMIRAEVAAAIGGAAPRRRGNG